MERRSILFAQLRYQRCMIEKLSSLFQTVSLGTWVNKGRGEDLVPGCRLGRIST